MNIAGICGQQKYFTENLKQQNKCRIVRRSLLRMLCFDHSGNVMNEARFRFPFFISNHVYYKLLDNPVDNSNWISVSKIFVVLESALRVRAVAACVWVYANASTASDCAFANLMDIRSYSLGSWVQAHCSFHESKTQTTTKPATYRQCFANIQPHTQIGQAWSHRRTLNRKH